MSPVLWRGCLSTPDFQVHIQFGAFLRYPGWHLIFTNAEPQKLSWTPGGLEDQAECVGKWGTLFSTLSKVMTSVFNTQAFKYFSWKSARDHPEHPPAQWLGNSSGSSGVTLFFCFWFWEEIQPEAGRISSNPIVTNSIAYQTSAWRKGISSCNDSDEINKLLFLQGSQKSYQQ